MGFTPISTVEEANAQLSQLWDQVQHQKNNNVNLHGRTVTGGAAGSKSTDYVTVNQLQSFIKQGYVPGTTTPSTPNFSALFNRSNIWNALQRFFKGIESLFVSFKYGGLLPSSGVGAEFVASAAKNPGSPALAQGLFLLDQLGTTVVNVNHEVSATYPGAPATFVKDELLPYTDISQDLGLPTGAGTVRWAGVYAYGARFEGTPYTTSRTSTASGTGLELGVGSITAQSLPGNVPTPLGISGSNINMAPSGTFGINGNTGISVTITTAKLTGGGSNGSMTFYKGILTSQVQAT